MAGSPAESAAAASLRSTLRRVSGLPSGGATLELPDGTSLRLRFTAVERRGPDRATLRGAVEGAPGSSAILVLHDGLVVGDVRGVHGGPLALRLGREGVLQASAATDVDPALEPCGAVPDDDAGPRESPSRTSDSRAGAACPAALSIVDMLVVATPAAVEELGGLAMVEADAFLSAALADETLANSEIPARIRLVHVAPVEYVESGNMALDLVRLRAVGDGHLDEVHGLRDAHGADLVCLRVASGQFCGLAFIAKDPPLSTSGFSVVQCGGTVPAHEWGHSLGACHAPGDDNGVGACDVQGGAYPDSHGHRFVVPDGTLHRTMMAYSPGSKILNFSNPDVKHLGVPTGVAEQADNARAITALAPAVAAFRGSVFVDCDRDGVDDLCAILDGSLPDCDGNWVPDGCDLAAGATIDSDGDGVPDVCDPLGDLDGDADVDSGDLALLLGSWGPCRHCAADLDQSGVVDAADLGALLTTWSE